LKFVFDGELERKGEFVDEEQFPACSYRDRPLLQASIGLVALPSAVTVAWLFVASTLRRWGAMSIEPQMRSVAADLVGRAVDETGPGSVNWAEIRELNPITVNLVGYSRHILIKVADVVSLQTWPLARSAGVKSGFVTGPLP
jgi:hypothetical protein